MPSIGLTVIVDFAGFPDFAAFVLTVSSATILPASSLSQPPYVAAFSAVKAPSAAIPLGYRSDGISGSGSFGFGLGGLGLGGVGSDFFSIVNVAVMLGIDT